MHVAACGRLEAWGLGWVAYAGGNTLLGMALVLLMELQARMTRTAAAPPSLGPGASRSGGGTGSSARPVSAGPRS